eukprot:TRINITY_DN11635_c0_g1_i1.p1 TRINITY_DN11635_c0_g1~~TRINITY_DN11635_c0_g1_i1.p1  ORF type:complete len:105 (+),score=21.41 TRINITY_DN11635_c0_g1_i1:186-500(+)
MSRPAALVFLFLILILTSQFEWKQQFASESEPDAVVSKEHRVPNNKELVKEQIILFQEKKIHELNELVRKMQQQLADCKALLKNSSTTDPRMPYLSASKEFKED